MTQYYKIKRKTSGPTDIIMGKILVIFIRKGKHLQVTLNCSMWINSNMGHIQKYIMYDIFCTTTVCTHTLIPSIFDWSACQGKVKISSTH